MCKHIKKLNRVFYFLWFLVLLTAWTGPPVMASEPDHGLAVPEITLNAENLNEGLPLNTRWHFIGPDNKAYLAEVPARWEKVYGQLWPVFGKGVYTLNVKIPKTFVGTNLKLYNELIAGTHFKVYVNEKLVGHNGLQLGSRSRISEFSVFEAPDERLKIKVEVINQTLQWSGLVRPLWIGTNASIVKKSYQRSIDFNIIFGVFTFLAFFHLILFVFFRQDKTVFWFGCLCFSIAVYMEFFRMHNLEYIFGGIPLDWNVKFLRLGLYGVIPSLFWYAQALSEKYMNIKITWTVTLISLGFALTVVLPSKIHTPLVYIWFVFMLMCIAYNIYLLLRLYNKKELAPFVYSGLAFCVATINDILNALHILSNGFYARYGFLIFCLVQTGFLAWRLQKNFRESQQLHNELRDVNENLEGLVETRTAEVQRQNEQLQELMRFKEEMVDMLVHDLKTPLNVLLSVPQEKKTGDLPVMQQAGERVHALINQMVNINQNESATIDLKIQPHPLHPLCQKVIRVLQPWAFSKGILLASFLNSESEVLIDAPLFERVIQNLLENAIKNAPENSEVKISGHISDAFFELSIFNHGEPLSAHVQANLFKKGVSVSSGDLPPSTGLGLYFCHQVLQAHQGKIEAQNIRSENPQERGVQFKLYIPIPPTETTLETHWSAQQRQQILPWMAQLNALEVYQISELRPILEELTHIQDPEIQNWVKHLNTSIKEVNETTYRQLLEQVHSYFNRG